MPKQPILSILLPCYNEVQSLPKILDLVRAVDIDKEIIAIDDCSTDGTIDVLTNEASRNSCLQVTRHAKNKGKGAAIRTGLQLAQGQITLIQDADLEYDPNDYYALVQPILDHRVEVVFGSRFLGPHTGMYFWNAIGNKVLTFLTNFLYNCWISDMETCYKVMRTEIWHHLDLQSNDFRLEPEITAKVLRLGHRIYEVPIHYVGRTYAEGKKMHPSQGLYAIWTLFRYYRWHGPDGRS